MEGKIRIVGNDYTGKIRIARNEIHIDSTAKDVKKRETFISVLIGLGLGIVIMATGGILIAVAQNKQNNKKAVGLVENSDFDEEEYSRDGYDPDDPSTWNDAEWAASISEDENEGVANAIEWGLDH